MENTKYNLNKILEQYDFKSDKKVRNSALDGSLNIIERCENIISRQKTLIESLERTNELASVLLQYNTLRTDKLKSRIKVLGFALAIAVVFALVLAFKAFL